MNEIRKILFDNGLKFNITNDEKRMYIFISGIVIYDVIEKIKRWLVDYNVRVFKSKSEEVTIELKLNTMINYKQIEDSLSTNYPIITCVDRENNVLGVRVNVPAITKYKHLSFIRNMFSGEGVKIYYDCNKEFVEIKIQD